MAYNDDQRAAGLAALQANGGNLRQTSRETGIGVNTLRRWRSESGTHKSQAAANRLPDAISNLSDHLRTFAYAALAVAPDKLNDATLRDVMTSAGIAIDKLQLLEGKPTSIDEVRDALSDDERAARVEAILERARARRAGRVPPS